MSHQISYDSSLETNNKANTYQLALMKRNLMLHHNLHHDPTGLIVAQDRKVEEDTGLSIKFLRAEFSNFPYVEGDTPNEHFAGWIHALNMYSLDKLNPKGAA